MPNHFHLLVETPQGGLVAGRQWVLGTYTGRFNRRHKPCGHLFSGRYKALIVDGSGDGYLAISPPRIRLRQLTLVFDAGSPGSCLVGCPARFNSTVAALGAGDCLQPPIV